MRKSYKLEWYEFHHILKAIRTMISVNEEKSSHPNTRIHD
jgi:hypothetical protein